MAQHAHRESDILDEVGDVPGAAHGVLPLFSDLVTFCGDMVEILEALQRLTARVCRVNAAGDEFAGPHLDVELEFVGHFFGGRQRENRLRQRIAGLALAGHAGTSSTRATSRAKTSHSAVSARRWRRPAAVSW